MDTTIEHVDVLIVGAGLSGIGAAYMIQTRCPKKRYAILEARDSIGGTWDLFRYPGVRSDSDMYTLGFSFRPWREARAIANGPAILAYIRETARAYGIERHIRFGHRLRRAEWSSAAARWTVEAERATGAVCSGVGLRSTPRPTPRPRARPTGRPSEAPLCPPQGSTRLASPGTPQGHPRDAPRTPRRRRFFASHCPKPRLWPPTSI